MQIYPYSTVFENVHRLTANKYIPRYTQSLGILGLSVTLLDRFEVYQILVEEGPPTAAQPQKAMPFVLGSQLGERERE